MGVGEAGLRDFTEVPKGTAVPLPQGWDPNPQQPTTISRGILARSPYTWGTLPPGDQTPRDSATLRFPLPQLILAMVVGILPEGRMIILNIRKAVGMLRLSMVLPLLHHWGRFLCS